MSIIKVTLPLGEIPVNGKQVSFVAPCDCAVTEALQIEGVNYTVVDALCNCATGDGGRWAAGAIVSVVLDCENKKAYLQNQATIKPSRQNLVRNWNMANPINQRGQTNYTTSGFFIDGWKSTGSATNFTIDRALKMSHTQGFFNRMNQKVDNIEQLIGRQVTLSAIVSGTTTLGMYIFINGSSTSTASLVKAVTEEEVLYSITCTIPANTTTADVAIGVPGNGATGDLIIHAVKLELGSTQTLAWQDATGKWVLNDAQPDKSMELLRCCMSTADSSDTYANNKVTPAAINAVNKAGDSMTGTLTLPRIELLASSNSEHDVVIAASAKGELWKATINGSTNTLLHDGNVGMYGVAKIATGSYVGTGTYGVNNPCTLTALGFAPKFVMVYMDDMGSLSGSRDGITQYSFTLMAARPALKASRYTKTLVNENNSFQSAEVTDHFEWGEDSFSWYTEFSNSSGGAPLGQLNESGKTFYYIAIG